MKARISLIAIAAFTVLVAGCAHRTQTAVVAPASTTTYAAAPAPVVTTTETTVAAAPAPAPEVSSTTTMSAPPAAPAKPARADRN